VGDKMKEIKHINSLFILSVLLISVCLAAVIYPSHGVLNWKGQNWYLSGGKSNPGNIVTLLYNATFRYLAP
jgi:hypothetical protein